jgi:NAD+ diphosphatase
MLSNASSGKRPGFVSGISSTTQDSLGFAYDLFSVILGLMLNQPFPANLMVGFYATGDPSELIRTDLDNELEDARWYTREEILAVLLHKEGTNFSRSDYKQLTKEIDERVNVKLSGSDPLSGDAAAHDRNSQPQDASTSVASGVNEPPFRVPPRTAIAGVLISDWALGNAVAIKGRM